MRKLYFSILSLFLLNSYCASSQNTSVFLGYRTINYPELTIEKHRDSSISYGLSLNYSVSFLNSMNHTAFSTSINRDGPGIGIFFQKPQQESSMNKNSAFMRLTLEYNYWESGKLKYDDGRAWPGSGSSYTDYDEYEEKYHNLGLLASHIRYTKSKKFGFYYQGGIHVRKVYRQYLIEGSWSSRRESDRKEILWRPGFSLRVGFFFRLFQVS